MNKSGLGDIGTVGKILIVLLAVLVLIVIFTNTTKELQQCRVPNQCVAASDCEEGAVLNSMYCEDPAKTQVCCQRVKEKPQETTSILAKGESYTLKEYQHSVKVDDISADGSTVTLTITSTPVTETFTAGVPKQVTLTEADGTQKVYEVTVATRKIGDIWQATVQMKQVVPVGSDGTGSGDSPSVISVIHKEAEVKNGQTVQYTDSAELHFSFKVQNPPGSCVAYIADSANKLLADTNGEVREVFEKDACKEWQEFPWQLDAGLDAKYLQIISFKDGCTPRPRGAPDDAQYYNSKLASCWASSVKIVLQKQVPYGPPDNGTGNPENNQPNIAVCEPNKIIQTRCACGSVDFDPLLLQPREHACINNALQQFPSSSNCPSGIKTQSTCRCGDDILTESMTDLFCFESIAYSCTELNSCNGYCALDGEPNDCLEDTVTLCDNNPCGFGSGCQLSGSGIQTRTCTAYYT
ncbi:hypothetical protein C4573_01260 [Candidatus Woesearchaeota archaeon]|nr:MAG: hypothetical protein C4573_01260 [Candidatus Woesearchaeota archaeon]